MQDVEFVGLSGGELTLLDDFAERVDILVKSLKRIKTINVILNCVDVVLTKTLIDDLLAFEKRVNVSVELSLDGLASIHDKNRGVIGNYVNVLKIVGYLKMKNCSFRCACTITKENCLHVDSLLQYCNNNEIKIKFRLASFIDRLSNADIAGVIDSFSDNEKYQLKLFFHKLLNTKKDVRQKNIYINLLEKLSKNYSRRIKCPYWNRSVYIDSSGYLYVCAPCSRRLASLKEVKSVFVLGRKLVLERIRLKLHSCKNCFHDYMAELVFGY